MINSGDSRFVLPGTIDRYGVLQTALKIAILRLNTVRELLIGPLVDYNGLVRVVLVCQLF